MKRFIISLLLLIPPLLLLQKMRSIPREPIPISTSAQEAEVRGAEAAAAEYKRAGENS
jgi:hypothetical protein